jgi:hypothetical protein
MTARIFSLEVLRARKGDCLLLHYGTTTDRRLALIDGGPSGVYGPILRPRLEELRTEREPNIRDPLAIDLLMISHIDDDHIRGVLQLTDELVEARNMQTPGLVHVRNLWHNTFDDIIGDDADVLARAVTADFGVAALNDPLLNDPLVVDTAGDLPGTTSHEAVLDAYRVLASVPQGRQLRDDAIKLGIERNLEVDGEFIVADSQPLDMGAGLMFTVLGPTRHKLEELRQKHRDWLLAHPEAVRASATGLANYADKSVTNLSSIVVLAELHDRRILLTGDARGDNILEGLELASLVDRSGKMHLDILKCPHHGSANTVDTGFFERIVADHYVFSGNGEHGNPERETIERLFAARGSNQYTIHLTYPVEDIDAERKRNWEKRRAAEQNRHDKKPEAQVRPRWSDATHALAAFIEHNAGIKQMFQVVPENRPHIINLLAR